MQLAMYKYRTLKERGEWKAPSAQEEKIIVFHVEINNLKIKSSMKSTKHELKKSKQPSAVNSKRKSPATRGNHQDWMGVPLPKGKPKTKNMVDKTYN